VADQKISELDVASSLEASDQFVIARAGANKRVAASVVTVASTDLTSHLNDSSAAHAASAISFSPDGTIAASTVQAAIVEVRDEAAPLTSSFSSQSDNYTLVLADAGKIVGIDHASAKTLTIPLNSSVAFSTGTVVTVRQAGAGQVTVAATGGVTLRSRGSIFKLAGQYAYATLVKVATDTWELSGDIVQ
jgi:hypothetical protein